jgi:hypothetical protein
LSTIVKLAKLAARLSSQFRAVRQLTLVVTLAAGYGIMA